MKLYKIDKGIEIPKPSVGKSDGRPSRVGLTLAELQKGDSFLITGELEVLKAQKVVIDCNGRERKRKGKAARLFACRKLKKGMRVWRVK